MLFLVFDNFLRLNLKFNLILHLHLQFLAFGSVLAASICSQVLFGKTRLGTSYLGYIGILLRLCRLSQAQAATSTGPRCEYPTGDYSSSDLGAATPGKRNVYISHVLFGSRRLGHAVGCSRRGSVSEAASWLRRQWGSWRWCGDPQFCGSSARWTWLLGW